MSDENKDEFEHNDGLGDLLREREKLEFSWSKTIVVLCTLFSVVIVGIYFIFNVGKSVITTEIEEKVIAKAAPLKPKVNDIKASRKQPQKASSKVTKKPASSKPKSSKKKGQNTLKKNSTDSTTISISSNKNKKIVVKKPIVKPIKHKKRQSQARAYQDPNLNKYQYKVITGTFSSRDNAVEHLNQLKSVGLKGFIKQTKTSLGSYFRVQVGAYKTQKNAKEQQAKLQSINIESYIYQE